MGSLPAKQRAGHESIQDSIECGPELFPFKTKGVLLASSRYENLDRDRVRIHFDSRNIEGILDGGHNTLAIGLLILKRALDFTGGKLPRGQKTWGIFKAFWTQYRSNIDEYQKAVRKDEDGTAPETTAEGDLSFYVPMELIVPTDSDDRMCVTEFRNNLLEICEARNNNAQLTTGTKASQKGYFDTLSQQLRLQNKQIADRVEWKSNDGGDIPIQNLIALTWIPLTLIPPVSDANTLQWKTNPQNFVEQHFDEIMRQYYRT